MTARTLYDRIWDDHVVATQDDGTCLIYVDRHLVHEVTSPQAFEALRLAGRPVRRPELTLAVPDHNVPTTARRFADGSRVPISDPQSAAQLSALQRNTSEFGVPYISETAREQGIVHTIGPELGFTLPGTVVVCGDSHTSTHGALGALAFGIGTSEVEHVLATQTLLLRKSKAMEVRIEGTLRSGVTAKDVILAVIRRIGAAGEAQREQRGAGAARHGAAPAVLRAARRAGAPPGHVVELGARAAARGIHRGRREAPPPMLLVSPQVRA